MATLGLIKNGHKEKLGVMPGTYPANRVNYNNNESGISATNVQDAIDELASGGGGGHTIEDTDGTEMPQENSLQFVGVYTEDDATNDRTKVNIVRPMTKEQYEALTPAQKKGFIRTTDEPDNPIVENSSNGIVASGITYETTNKTSILNFSISSGVGFASNAWTQYVTITPSELRPRVTSFATVFLGVGMGLLSLRTDGVVSIFNPNTSAGTQLYGQIAIIN